MLNILSQATASATSMCNLHLVQGGGHTKFNCCLRQDLWFLLMHATLGCWLATRNYEAASRTYLQVTNLLCGACPQRSLISMLLVRKSGVGKTGRNTQRLARLEVYARVYVPNRKHNGSHMCKQLSRLVVGRFIIL